MVVVILNLCLLINYLCKLVLFFIISKTLEKIIYR